MFWQQNEISTVICSSWAQKKKNCYLVPHLPARLCNCVSRIQQKGAVLGSMGETRTLSEIRACFNCESSKGTIQIHWFHICTLPLHKSEPRSVGEGVSHLRALGEASLSGKYLWNFYLKRRESTLLKALACFCPISDNYWSNTGPLVRAGASLGGDHGRLGLEGGGGKAEVMTGLGRFAAKSTHVTWHPVSSLLPTTAHGNYFSTHPGEGMQDFFE